MANTMIATKSVNYNNSESAKQNLLNNVKVQVKKLMEEAVIRSYVHEDSETITKFCSSVETVLLYGIRRSIFTWMEEEATFILCQKIAKFCPEAQQTLDRMEFHKQAILKRRNDLQSKRNNSPLCIKTKSPNSLLSPSPSSSSSSSSSEKSSPSMHFTFWANENKNNFHQSSNTTLVNGRRDTAFQNFWIRVALLEKVLDKIVYFLTIHSSQYYEHCSIIADPCDGQLITDLLRGPCTIDYSRTRTTDHLFTDPPVSELIQRHGIYGGLMSRQLSYVPPVSQQLTTDEQTQESDEDDDNIPTDTTKINSNNTSPMDLLKQSQKLLNTDKVNHNDTTLNDNSKRKTKYISIPAITMNPLEEEKEDDKIGLGYEEDDDGTSHLPIDSIINNNRKRYNNRKNDLNAGNLNTLNQSGWMTKRASSPLLNVNDLPTSRGIRTGSCALLPQINEYNSTKSNRNPKSTKNIALAAKDHVESMHQSLKTILLYGKNNVLMQPTNSSDPIPGYLSLISCESGKLVLLKWTPNSAVTNQYNLSPLSLTNTINNNSNNTNLYSSTDSLIDSRLDIDSIEDKETYWGYAIKIKMDDIVYAHYHESSDQYIMTLIRNDGIQLAPFHFYAQSHIVTLLNCLEQGFKKSGGYLDPSPNISDTSSACIPSSFNKSYRPSMPFIFANRNSLLPSSTNNKLDSTVSHASSPLLQTSLSPLLKSSKLEQSIPITSSNHITIVSGGGAGGIKQRFYMNFLKAFSHPDEMNNEGIQKTNISQSIDLSAERYPVQHVYHIVSKCNEIRTVVSPRSKTSPIGFGFNKVSALSNKVSLEGISEENMPNLDDITVQLAEDNSSNQHICTKLRIKILSHLFHKWYNYFNKIQIVRKKLSDLVSSNLLTVDSPTNAEEGVTINLWNQLITNSIPKITFSEFCRHIYFGNCDPTIRNQVWPYLLGLYPWDSTDDQVRGINEQQNHIYTNALMTWNRVVDCLQKDVKYANFLSIIPTKSSTDTKISESSEEISTKESNDSEIDDTSKVQSMNGGVTGESKPVNIHPSETNETPVYHIQTPELTESHSRTVSVDSTSNVGETKNPPSEKQCEFSPDTLEAFADNLYRIDKDVSRCDRNHVFFMTPFKGDSKSSPRDHAELNSNLYKLRNIISTWVWLNLDVGYIQGMCDLLAPILIIMEDEVISFACFTCLMKWMLPNFPLVKESSISKSSGSSSSSSPSVMTSSIINDIPTTLTSNDTGMNRKTLLQLAVKAAKRRTTSTHIRESGVDNSYAGKHFPVDTNLRCTSKLKEEATLQESTKRSDAIQQEIIEFTSSVISPYERVLLNSTGLPMSCMDMRFSFLQSLIEIFDPEMNQHLSKKVPDGQLFFAYRWLLLDFKRELKYDDIFPVWETIWASRRLVSYDFGIFFALALLEYYRDIVIYYNMDVTEIIRFYNELTEQHDAITLVELARSYVFQLQHLMKDM